MKPESASDNGGSKALSGHSWSKPVYPGGHPPLFAAESDEIVQELLAAGADPHLEFGGQTACSVYMCLDRVSPARAYLEAAGLPDLTRRAIDSGNLRLSWRMRRMLDHFLATGSASLADSLTATEILTSRHPLVRSVGAGITLSVCHGSVLVRWRRSGEGWAPEEWVDSGENQVTWLERSATDPSSLLVASVPTGLVKLNLADMSPQRVARLAPSRGGRVTLVGCGGITRTTVYPPNPGCEDARLNRDNTVAAVGQQVGHVVVSADWANFWEIDVSHHVATVTWLGTDLALASMPDSDCGELFDLRITRLSGAADASRVEWEQHLGSVSGVSAMVTSDSEDRIALIGIDDYYAHHPISEAEPVHGELLVLDARNGEILQRDPVALYRGDSRTPRRQARQMVAFIGEVIAVSDVSGVRLGAGPEQRTISIPLRPAAIDAAATGLMVGTDKGILEVTLPRTLI